MAKRSTIGENPLDVIRGESPLDAVVPDLSAPRPPGRPQELAPELKERLERLESGLRAATAETAQLRGWLAPQKDEANKVKGEMAQLKSEMSRLAAEVARLASDFSNLKTELIQMVQATSKSPSDLPWWMGGRKKQ
jgi:predicted RNase H-like nuclease (RuvC/YqgF family)